MAYTARVYRRDRKIRQRLFQHRLLSAVVAKGNKHVLEDGLNEARCERDERVSATSRDVPEGLSAQERNDALGEHAQNPLQTLDPFPRLLQWEVGPFAGQGRAGRVPASQRTLLLGLYHSTEGAGGRVATWLLLLRQLLEWET